MPFSLTDSQVKRLSLALIISLFVLLSLKTGVAINPDFTNITIEPESRKVQLRDTFKVNITVEVNDTANISSVALDLNFNGDVLNVTNIDKGSIHGSESLWYDVGGFHDFDEGGLDNDGGYIDYMWGNSESGGTHTSGVFATVEFKGIKSGKSWINFSYSSLSSDAPIPPPPPYWNSLNGSVIVSEVPNKPKDPIPEDGANVQDPTGQTASVNLSVNVTDPDGDKMNISFYDARDDSLIGTVNNVESGNRANVTWDGLRREEIYWWYAKATDPAGGTARSDTWSFMVLPNIQWTNLTMIGGQEDVLLGQEFTLGIDLQLNESVNVSDVGADLIFNDTLLEVLSVDQGDLFDDWQNFDNGTTSGGIIEGMFGNGSGATQTSGSFAEITFKTLKAGTSDLKLNNTSIHDGSGSSPKYNVLDGAVLISNKTQPHLIPLDRKSTIPDAYVSQPYEAALKIKNVDDFTAYIMQENVLDVSPDGVRIYPSAYNPSEIRPGEIKTFYVRSDEIPCETYGEDLNFSYQLMAQGGPKQAMWINKSRPIKNPLETSFSEDKVIVGRRTGTTSLVVSNRGRAMEEYKMNLMNLSGEGVQGNVLVTVQTPNDRTLYLSDFENREFDIGGRSDQVFLFRLSSISPGKSGTITFNISAVDCSGLSESSSVEWGTGSVEYDVLGFSISTGPGIEVSSIPVLSLIAVLVYFWFEKES